MKKYIFVLSILCVFNTGCVSQPVKNTSQNYLSTEQRFTDAAIDTKVKGSFINNKLLGNDDLFVSSVHVNTVDGVVYLSGSVKTKEQADKAVQLAKEERDVKQVRSSIVVK